MERSSVLCLRTERTRRRRSPRSVRTLASPRTSVVVRTPEGRRRTTKTRTLAHHCHHHHHHHHHHRRRHRSQTPVEAKHHEPNLCLHVAHALVPTPMPTPPTPSIHIARRARCVSVFSTPTRASTAVCSLQCEVKPFGALQSAVRSETVAKFTRENYVTRRRSHTRRFDS